MAVAAMSEATLKILPKNIFIVLVLFFDSKTGWSLYMFHLIRGFKYADLSDPGMRDSLLVVIWRAGRPSIYT
jgi:hypothetical protein